jgi:hypothetical protein
MTELKYDKIWHQQYEKLVELKRKSGDCIVPQSNKEDKPLGVSICTQRRYHTKKKMRLIDRKELLDEMGFIWKVDTLAAHVRPILE